MTKKELLHLRREHDKLDRTLGGIRDMARVPSAIWVVDTKKEHIAVNEARKLNIPVVAILDTNCDPDEVNYPIPGNDDAIRSVALLTRVVADAVADGLISRSGAAEADVKPDEQFTTSEEPLPEWERDLLQTPAEGEAPAEADAPAADAAEADAAPAQETQESAVSTDADAKADIAEAEPAEERIAEAAAEAPADEAVQAAADAE
jgi:small subunit ribosomal protein S2